MLLEFSGLRPHVREAHPPFRAGTDHRFATRPGHRPAAGTEVASASELNVFSSSTPLAPSDTREEEQPSCGTVARLSSADILPC